MQDNHQSGFSVAGILLVFVIIFVASFLAYTQWIYFEQTERNSERKQAINSVHFYLKEVHYPKNKSYPSVLSSEIIEAAAQDSAEGPVKRLGGDSYSDMIYHPGDCKAGKCSRYILRADLEQAKDFIRRGEASSQ